MAGIDLGEQSLEVAVAPQSVSLRLADDVDVSRGDLIAAGRRDPVPLRQEVTALACWLGDDALRPGARAARQARVAHRARRGALDRRPARPRRPARWRRPTGLALNDIGRVTVRFASPLPVESYSTSRRGGAFLLVDPDDGRTLAAAMADAVAPGEHPQ